MTDWKHRKEPGTERRVIIPKDPKTGKPTTKPDPGPKHVPPTEPPKEGK